MPDEGFRKWLGIEYEVMEDGHAVAGLGAFITRRIHATDPTGLAPPEQGRFS